MTIKNRKKREMLYELVKDLRKQVKDILGEEADASITIHNISPMFFERREDEHRSRVNEDLTEVEGYLCNTDNAKLWLFSNHWIEKNVKQIDAELE
jgi:hypothetical protein